MHCAEGDTVKLSEKQQWELESLLDRSPERGYVLSQLARYPGFYRELNAMRSYLMEAFGEAAGAETFTTLIQQGIDSYVLTPPDQ